MVRAKQVDDRSYSTSNSSSSSVVSANKKGISSTRKSLPASTASSNSSRSLSTFTSHPTRQHSSTIVEDDVTVSDEDSEKLDLHYAKLQNSVNSSVPIDSLSNTPPLIICEECHFTKGYLVECQGQCQRSFHAECLGLMQDEVLEMTVKCDECLTGQHICFACKQTYTDEQSQITRKCVVASCGKFYHDKCAKANEMFRKDISWTAAKPAYICPLHTCNTCYAESKINKNHALDPLACTRGRFIKCVACPTAYHQTEYCVAAGSKLFTAMQLMCPLHFKPVKNNAHHNRVNVTWCFVCCQTGDLVGCSRCPAAYHGDCLRQNDRRYRVTASADDGVNNEGDTDADNSEENSKKKNNKATGAPKTTIESSPTEKLECIDRATWLCEDCMVNKRPLYGEIVWAKVGGYRWWPAQICLPRLFVDNSLGRTIQCMVGEFVVQFFGTFDFYSLNIGRCFTFAEGDSGGSTSRGGGGAFGSGSGGGNNLERAFAEACHQAKLAYTQCERIRASRAPKTATNKYNFQMIKTNRPYGSVQLPKVQLQDIPRCDCTPNEAAPCGSDSKCMNRMLKYECHPLVCPAGTRCLNQRFIKREYPKQEVINAGERGWGLRSCVDIKKGDFINEYVGEIIDDEECKRRMEHAHANNLTNFYFLTIDKDRVIDAGPKGNLARFANHSCDPNMETQKWVVNGDVRVGLFACKDIPSGTELTFNYQLDCLSNKKAVCKCGSKICAGFIGDRPKTGASANASAGSASNSNSNGNKKRKFSDAGEGLSTSVSEANLKKSKNLSNFSRIRSQSSIVSN